ncbi:hypothetical protein CERZMDRAFT_19219, partial [Cercospora zeae-maydis SCOH1-5]
LEQSSNKEVTRAKIMSASQLKSGDIILRTTSAGDIQTLQQYSEKWVRVVGEG